jgi:hypothetical protein
MQLFSAADTTIFKHTNAAKTAQTEEFMFQNVAYRPTVYKTGVFIMEYGTFIVVKIERNVSEIKIRMLFQKYCRPHYNLPRPTYNIC